MYFIYNIFSIFSVIPHILSHAFINNHNDLNANPYIHIISVFDSFRGPISTETVKKGVQQNSHTRNII